MIFHKALVREFANTALATFFVLLGITLTTQLVKLLGQAAVGLITSTGVLALLGFTLVNYLAVLLSLTTFIAVLLTLTRSYRDSEMVVWFASGLGLTQWIRPVLAFALPLVVLIGLLSLVLSPWAVSRSEDLRRAMDSRDDVAAIVPGVFRESNRAERVYFVEEISGSENMVANVFVSSNQHQKLGVMVARRGYQETAENGDRFLVLLNGRRYEGTPGTPEYRLYEFERYAMRVEIGAAAARAPTTKTAATIDLIREPSARNLAELSWRVGLPLSALVLSMIAVPLSFVNPRSGRSMNLVLALLVYMTYSNLLSVVQAWIYQSRMSFAVGLGVHVLMLAVLVALFYRRMMPFTFFRFAR
ncbi:MAG TPA: LPS export ABC transporter permease LptF [Burkholderiales bacterium]|jgi:lipopolysaccharide export system permease protein|nr:LPS export ABC transporter permease LptF [Burkholderiales bacterium]